MDREEKIKEINSLIEQTKELEVGDREGLDKLKSGTDLIIRRVFGDDSPYVKKWNLEVKFLPMIVASTNDMEKKETWERGRKKALNLFDIMLKDIYLSGQ